MYGNIRKEDAMLEWDSTSLPTPGLPTLVLPTKGLDVLFRLHRNLYIHIQINALTPTACHIQYAMLCAKAI